MLWEGMVEPRNPDAILDFDMEGSTIWVSQHRVLQFASGPVGLVSRSIAVTERTEKQPDPARWFGGFLGPIGDEKERDDMDAIIVCVAI